MGSTFRILTYAFVLILISFHSNGENNSSQLLIQKITLDEGLPNNKVNAIAQDKNGFMWFGTNDGVCRYDGFQLRFYALDDFKGGDSRTPQISTIKMDSLGNLLIGSYSLFYYDYVNDRIENCKMQPDQDPVQSIGRVHSIETGSNGLFYVGAENGLFTYDPVLEKISLISNELSDDNYILSLFSDGVQIWIGTKQAKLYCYQFDRKKIVQIKSYNLPSIQNNQILCFFKPTENSIWMGTQNSGLIQFDLTDSILTLTKPDPAIGLTFRIRKIMEDKNGNIWIGTRGGLYKYDAGKFICKAHQGHPISNMTSSSIYDIFIDDHSTMWLGTYSGGVNYIHLNRKPFDIEKPEQSISILEKSNINCFGEDKQLNLWIGTESLGLIYKDKKTGTFDFCSSKLTKNHNPSTSIKAIAVDSSDNVWVGTYSGLSYINTKTQQIIDYTTSNSSLSSNKIRSIQIDAYQNVWIGTNNGLNCFDSESNTFHTLFNDLEIHPVYIDHEQSIWFGSSPDGIFRKKANQKKFENVYRQYFNSFIRGILVDTNHNLWIGNNKGLYFVDQKTNELISYGLSEGLPSIRINGLLEDDDKNLWVSTDAGLLKGDQAIDHPHKVTFNKFSINDGLQGQLFRVNASMKSQNGEMYFGGDHGYNKFFPENINSDYNTPKIAFTDFKIFNESVEIGQEMDGYIVLSKAINELQTIDLSYKHRLFTIDFAALHYTNPKDNQYRYRLLPFQKKWIYSSGFRNFANYSNLNGGNYTFELEVANSDNIWNTTTRKLDIKIHPPFWETLWFILCVVAFVSGLIITIYFNRISRLKRYNYELENKVVQRTKELKDSLDQLLNKQSVIEEQTSILNSQKDKLQELILTKDKFFTIIAHDLKNPFQSILGMAELLEEKLNDDKSKNTQHFVHEILSSTTRVFNLLENLLTWSRTQTNRISYCPENLYISTLIYRSLQLFEKNISDKNIVVNFDIKSEDLVYVDSNMIETVIRNLISNAIKFSPVLGTISILIQQLPTEIKISISDMGTGIRQDELNMLFRIGENKSRPGTEGEKGTGLGLIISKEFVLRNKGQIWVESELHKGSTFFITIPLEKNNFIAG